MQKDILFYSNLCEFCKQVLTNLVKNNIKNKFMLVCVDNKNLNLPPFVDRVPLIYTTQKKVFADDNLINFIQSKVASSSLQPYSLVGLNTNSFSDNYSFISDSDNVLEDSSRNYNMIGVEESIYVPEDSENGGGSKVDSKILEKFMADREMDNQKIYGNGNGNGPFNRI
jgi:hypothetical protein